MSLDHACLSIHQAARAVLAVYLEVEVRKVSIVPNHESRGCFETGEVFCGPGLGSDRANLERQIQICLAGPIAASRFHTRHARRQRDRRDFDMASGLARYLAGSAGEREFLRHQEVITHRLIVSLWDQIDRVAWALYERDELTGADIRRILEAPEGLLLTAELPR